MRYINIWEGGPQVHSQYFQWFSVDELGRGEAGGAGREGTCSGSRGERSVASRRMLQSEPALHSNQRCGGCAAPPSIFHTKGRPPPSPSEPSAPAPPLRPRDFGSAKRQRKGKMDTQTETERPSTFSLDRLSGVDKVELIVAPWRLKTWKQSEQRQTLAEWRRDRPRDKREHPESQ